MKCRKAYAIIPVGENDRSAHVAQQKAPEVATPGLFYSVREGVRCKRLWRKKKESRRAAQAALIGKIGIVPLPETV